MGIKISQFIILFVYMPIRYSYFHGTFIGHAVVHDLSPFLVFVTMYIYSVFLEHQVAKCVHENFQKVKETESLWFGCLHKLQSGVMISNLDEKKYIF